MWSGAVSFGLIYIPVKMYKTTEERHPNFHLYRKSDLCPVQYVRVCKANGEEIAFKDVVRGYEYQKGDVVILHDKDLNQVYSKKTETIEIIEFIDSKEIDSKYFEKPYYLEPEKGAGKVYFLLVEALRKSKKVGIGRFVLKNLEYLGVLKEEKGILMLNEMRLFSEIRKTNDLNIPLKQKISSPELDMAVQLIDQLSRPFDPQKYKDTYSEVLKKAIENKSKSDTKKVKIPETGPAEVVDLLGKLRKSLEEAKGEKNVS